MWRRRKLDTRGALRGGATAVAAARVAIGIAALVWPAVPSRPWVGTGTGDGAAGLASRVFGRALGGRDLALGLGALVALTQVGDEPATPGLPGEPQPGFVWVAAGALADSLDVVTTLVSWRELPRVSRWLVIGSAAAAAVTGAAGAVALRPAGPGWRARPDRPLGPLRGADDA
jgi:hypothetical protein